MSRLRRQRIRSGTRADARSEKMASELRRWNKGDPLTAKRLSEMVDAINRAMSVTQAQQQQRDILTVPFKAIVLQEFDDYLKVQRVDGASSASENLRGSLLVAKPWLLRRLPFDGFERQGVLITHDDPAGEEETEVGRRFATFSSADQEEQAGTPEDFQEAQYITPSYLVNDLIFVAFIENGTGVFVNGLTPLNMVDMNCDGRSWAAEVVPIPDAETAEPE